MTMDIELDTTELPVTVTTTPTSDEGPGPSTDPTCIVCGAALVYGGRGPKPKYCPDHKRHTATGTGTPRGRRGTADVESALAILSGLYDATAMGLLMVSPSSARTWVGNVEALQRTNAVTLTADRQLCAAVNRMGERSAKGTFIVAHLVAAVPVVLELRRDLAGRRAQTTAEDATADPTFPDFTVPPDARDLDVKRPRNGFFG